MLAYVDTSALLKLVLNEPERDALLDWVEQSRASMASSALVTVEARRGVRGLPPRARVEIDRVLDQVATIPVSSEICERAADLPPDVMRSLDAIHVASALVLGDALDVVVTYDERMADAARGAGLVVEAPGTSR